MRTNLGLSAHDVVANPPVAAFGVSEVEQGGVDLNGDGDGLDIVLHVYDERTRLTTNTGLSLRTALDLLVREPIIKGERVMFAVSEVAQGADLNADSDQADYVVHSFDVQTGAAENHGLAIVPVAQGGLTLGGPRFVVIGVSEHDQGMADWNGDGLSNAVMLHIVDLETGGVARHPDPLAWPYRVAVSDGSIAFQVSEEVAAADLNGDADTEDPVLFMGELSSGLIVNTGLAARVIKALPAGLWTLLVHEEFQGASDLDGDGDATGLVYASYDFPSGDLRYHGVSVGWIDSPNTGLGAGRVAVTGTEGASQDDWNGDGDQDDQIAILIDPQMETPIPTGLDGSWGFYPLVDGRFAFPIDERVTGGGLDLNGDGDTDDYVMQLLDPTTRSAINLGVDVEFVPDGWVPGYPMERFLLYYRSEVSNNQDWNQDGDTLDSILNWWDAHTNTFRRTDHSVFRVADVLGTTVIVRVAESSEGQDLNGDGDQLDDVLFAIDLVTGTQINLRTSATDPQLVANDRLLVSVPEGNQDLNADGDVDDNVLVAFDLFR